MVVILGTEVTMLDWTFLSGLDCKLLTEHHLDEGLPEIYAKTQLQGRRRRLHVVNTVCP